MSYIVSKLSKMEEAIIDRLYNEQIPSKERIGLEEQLDCLISQTKSRIEGWLTDIEKADRFSVVLGTGIIAKMESGTVEPRKLPYAAVIYAPKFLEKDFEKFLRTRDSLDSYLSEKAIDVQTMTIPVPLRIIGEMRLANAMNKQASWMGTKTSYFISNDNILTTSLADNGFSIQSYFPRENRKNGFASLVDITKEFENNLNTL